MVILNVDGINVNDYVYMVDDNRDYRVTYTNNKTVNGFTKIYLNLIHVGVDVDGNVLCTVKNDIYHLDCRKVVK